MNSELARHIRVLRNSKGLNQSELARLVGVNPSYVWEIERGRRHPSKKTLKAIAEALNCDYEALDALDTCLERDLIEWANETPGVRELLLKIRDRRLDAEQIAEELHD